MERPLVELAREYSESRLSILRLIMSKKAKERLIERETRAKLKRGGFPEWFSMYYDTNEKVDSLILLERLLAVWGKTNFQPNDVQQKSMEEATDAARRMARLRAERSVLQSMLNGISFTIVELSRHTGTVPHLQITREAARLVKSRTTPVDYLDSMQDVTAVDMIEKLFEEHPEMRQKVQEISLDHLSVMERVCFRMHIEIPMSYGQIADELTAIAKTVAAEYGIAEDVGLGKDSVATHVQNAQKKLLQHSYQRRMLTDDDEAEPNSPYDEYEREMRRRFSGGLYVKKGKSEAAVDPEKPTQVELL